MRIRFLGGAGTVTGSRTLLTSGETSVLVDGGLFQGFKVLRERNWGRLETDPRGLEAVLLTHGHLDHSGWVPRLVKQGFAGPVYCTDATAELVGILWRDAGRIQEEDAAYANREGFARHEPALPLYTEEDAERALERLVPVSWTTPQEVGPFSASFHRVGHILGAACVRLEDHGTSVLFSGDVGRVADLLMRAPAPPPQAEFAVLESTYGSRSHSDVDVLAQLSEVVRRTVERRGALLIPSFAVGRAQGVLWALHLLQERGEIPDVPLLLDSPMATSATELYVRHARELKVGPDRLDRLCDDVRFVRTTDESKALNREKPPYILVSASGMLTGGRVLHHLARLAGDRCNTVLFVGYQAPGTRGDRLVRGAGTVRLHGRDMEVRCEIAQIDGFSAHADADELLAWLAKMPQAPRRVWLNHGVPSAADALRMRVRDELGWNAAVATEGCEWDLDDLAARGVAPRLGV